MFSRRRPWRLTLLPRKPNHPVGVSLGRSFISLLWWVLLEGSILSILCRLFWHISSKNLLDLRDWWKPDLQFQLLTKSKTPWASSNHSSWNNGFASWAQPEVHSINQIISARDSVASLRSSGSQWAKQSLNSSSASRGFEEPLGPQRIPKSSLRSSPKKRLTHQFALVSTLRPRRHKWTKWYWSLNNQSRMTCSHFQMWSTFPYTFIWLVEVELDATDKCSHARY